MKMQVHTNLLVGLYSMITTPWSVSSVHQHQTLHLLWHLSNSVVYNLISSIFSHWQQYYYPLIRLQTFHVRNNFLSRSLLVPTVYGTDCEGVACPQDQSRAAVVLNGAHLVTGTGGGVRVHWHTISLHNILRGLGPLEGYLCCTSREGQ